MVAGHTHAGVAHFIEGVPVVEAYSRGRAFSRVDFVLDGTTHEITRSIIHPPHDLYPSVEDVACSAGDYEGEPVVPDASVAAADRPGLELAREKRSQALGLDLKASIPRDHGRESALGNLFVDLLLAEVEARTPRS